MHSATLLKKEQRNKFILPSGTLFYDKHRHKVVKVAYAYLLNSLYLPKSWPFMLDILDYYYGLYKISKVRESFAMQINQMRYKLKG